MIGEYVKMRMEAWRAAGSNGAHGDLARLNKELAGYPSNHTYKIAGKELVPSFELFRRWKAISALYPQRVTSLLDIGSCKGFFVLQAAKDPACSAAVGIDAYEPFVKMAIKVRDIVGRPNAKFHNAGLDAIARDVKSHGGPFEVITLLNVYHYLYYGSDLAPVSCRDHRKIFSDLATACSGRVIFTSPLELPECPKQIQEASAKEDGGQAYSTDKILGAAREFFNVEQAGRSGGRPLYLLTKHSAR